MIARTPLRHAPLALALLLVSGFAAAQLTVEDGAVHIRSNTDRGSAQVLLENLPPSNDLRAVSIARGTWRRANRVAAPVTGGGFPSLPYHTGAFFASNAEREAIAHFRARAADASPVALRVVDGGGRVHCEATGSGAAGATCTARVSLPAVGANGIGTFLELRVEAEQLGTQSTSVSVEGFFHQATAGASELELQVDPTVRPDATATVRIPLNLRVHAPGSVLAELIEVRDGNRSLRQFVSRSEWDGSATSASLALFRDGRIDSPTGSVRSLTTHAGLSAHRRIPFLVPANVDAVDIALTTYESPDGAVHPRGTPQDVVLELHHLDGDPTLARVDAVPPGRVPDVIVDAESSRPYPESASERVTLRGAQLKPGRWFAVPVSKTGIPLNLHLDVVFPAGRALEPAEGHYFNHARSGHGFYLAEAGSDWVLIWYTYDAAGAPVWYYAQAPRPSAYSGGSQWYASLYRNVWNGSRTRFQFVGFAQLAVTAEGRITFAHLVNGTLGIETMQRLGTTGCSQRWAGKSVDVNGLWYAPEKPGYGFSAEVIGDTEFFLAYAYDGFGRPTWATAQQRFDDSQRLPMLQAKGFCPTCDAGAVTRTEIGTLERQMIDAAAPDGLPGYGKLGIDARWTDGLPGGWRESRPTALLSARNGCR